MDNTCIQLSSCRRIWLVKLRYSMVMFILKCNAPIITIQHAFTIAYHHKKHKNVENA